MRKARGPRADVLVATIGICVFLSLVSPPAGVSWVVAFFSLKQFFLFVYFCRPARSASPILRLVELTGLEKHSCRSPMMYTAACRVQWLARCVVIFFRPPHKTFVLIRYLWAVHYVVFFSICAAVSL